MSIDELFQKACRLHQSGDLEHSRAGFEEVLRYASSHDRAAHLAGVTCLQLRDVPAAIQHFQRAIQLNSRDPSYHLNLSVAYSSINEFQKAIDACQRGIALEPQNVKAICQLARFYEHVHRRVDAIECYRRALLIEPNRSDACRMLARLLMQEPGGLSEAMQLLRKAVQLDPNVPESYNELGYVLQRLRRHDEAVQAFSAALQLKPVYAQAWNNISTAYRSLRRLDEAEKSCREAIRLEPTLTEAIVNLGIVLMDQTRLEEAIACFEKATTYRPNYVQALSRKLYCMQYLPGITPQKLLEAHRQFDIQFAKPNSSVPPIHDPVPDRKMTIGLVSEGFGKHPVGHFLASFLNKLPPDEMRLVCYSDRQQTDEVTELLRPCMSSWHDTTGKSNDDLFHLIQRARIDILLDLDGHAGSRMLVFARKPAPIQVTWMGYVGTTGLSSMDYVLADGWEIPKHLESCYCERVVRMPYGYVCYAAPAYAPEVAPPPLIENGYVVFGCFNQPSKVNRETIRVWSEVMKGVPNSRIRLQYKGYDSKTLRQRIHGEFLTHGIRSERVILADNTSHGELLKAYHSVDIGLDTFPYSGGLTTCEAMWMGVPIVTCPGDTFASRHSMSHLSNVGFTETIASSEEEYIRIAIELAQDTQRLQKIRATLREQMRASPLCDGERFARDWVAVLRGIWVSACEDQHRQK